MAYTNAASAALDGGDPRLSTAGQGITEFSRPTMRNLHDPSVTIEEYLHYAAITRAEEEALPVIKSPFKKVLGFGGKHDEKIVGPEDNNTSTRQPSTTGQGLDEKKAHGDALAPAPSVAVVADEEWVQASRAMRTATWGAVFYLITTDVLGPYSVPWALAQMGYGPGITLYTVFGALAGLTGYYIWEMFLHLDSNRYPMKTFGDIAFRIYGSAARHCVNVLQSIQLLFNVGAIIIANGNGLYQINRNICYIACCVIWAACGMVIGQIRTLQRLGWIANFAIWLNIVVMILTMVVVTHSDPNYASAATANGVDIGPPAPPVQTTGGPADGIEFTGQLVGLMQAVYSYGGAMLYCEFMSEMRRPWDFWKALIMAESFIYLAYLFFGVYVYSFQGQYAMNPANQGMSPHAALTAGNIIGFVSSLIAAALYGNIGIKVLYQNVLKELIGLPDLTTSLGKWLWFAIVPVYWALAYVVAAAIPNFSALTGLIAAVCILQFTYTFPPLLMLGYQIQTDAIRHEQGEGFDPATGQAIRLDHGMKRWVRGFFAGRWYYKLWNLFFFLAAFATCVLGTYSSVLSLIDAFKAGRATAFSCKGPV